MPPQRIVELTETQRAELRELRDHAELAYLRERAAAILKVADGQSVRQVALRSLLRVRDPETVSRWLAQYQALGGEGLRIKAGRGRKPKYFPPQS